MFIISNFIIALARLIDIVLVLFYWLILFRALISWVNPDPYNPIVQFLYRTTEPVLEPIRRFLPPGRIDFSAIIAFLIIIFLQAFVVGSLRDVAYHIRSANTSPVYQEAVPQNQNVKKEEFFK